MTYKVIVRLNAINDIGAFYRNTVRRYPNTWTIQDAIAQADKVIDEMSSAIIKGLNGQRTPLLVELQSNGTVELYTRDKRWYYTVRLERENAIIENAVYKGNESNRAYRRGSSTPHAPLHLDDRRNQTINRPVSPTQTYALSPKTRILKGTYYNGLKIGYYNRKYVILNSNGIPFCKVWFDQKPKILNAPYGIKHIIAYVSVHGWLRAVDVNGKIYDMNTTWKSRYLSKNEHHNIIGRIITEVLNNFLRRELIA